MNIQEYKELYPHCNPYKKTKEEAIKYIKDKYKLSKKEAEKRYRTFKSMWVLTPSEDDKFTSRNYKKKQCARTWKTYDSWEEYVAHSYSGEEKINKVLELYKKDYSRKAISVEAELAEDTIQRILATAYKFGIVKRKRRTPFGERMEAEKDRFIELYNQGLNNYELSQEFGASPSTVCNTIKEFIEKGYMKERERIHRRCIYK